MNNSAGCAQNAPRTLYRRPTQRVIAGVCGGIADWLGWNVAIVRMIFVALFFTTSAAMLPIYILLAVFLPVGTQQQGGVQRASVQRERHAHNPFVMIMIVGGGLWLLSDLGILPGLLDALFGMVRFVFWPALLIFIGWRILRAVGVRLNADGELGAKLQEWGRSAVVWGEQVGSQLGAQVSESQRGLAAGSLTRSSSDRMLLGVCGGIAARYNVDPAIVRLVWVIVAVATLGLGALAYGAAAMLLPEEGAASPATQSDAGDGTKEITILSDETRTL